MTLVHFAIHISLTSLPYFECSYFITKNTTTQRRLVIAAITSLQWYMAKQISIFADMNHFWPYTKEIFKSLLHFKEFEWHCSRFQNINTEAPLYISTSELNQVVPFVAFVLSTWTVNVLFVVWTSEPDIGVGIFASRYLISWSIKFQKSVLKIVKFVKYVYNCKCLFANKVNLLSASCTSIIFAQQSTNKPLL